MKTASLVTLGLVFASGFAPEALHQITNPTRRAATAPAPALPPVPADADRLPRQTVEVVLPTGPHTISRTPERILVAHRDREWLFERNTLDPRRASATRVEHTSRLIIVYEESDLRNLLGLNGWADVLAATSYSEQAPRGATIMGIRPQVDDAVMQPAARRFPTYEVLDVADWLEKP